jgi:hypothetical protein
MTIADLACYPWYGILVLGKIYDAAEFLNVKEYTHVVAWAEMMSKRTGMELGRRSSRTWGPGGRSACRKAFGSRTSRDLWNAYYQVEGAKAQFDHL